MIAAQSEIPRLWSCRKILKLCRSLKLRRMKQSALASSQTLSPHPAEDLIKGYDRLLERITTYTNRFPRVEGVNRLSRAVSKERQVAQNLCRGSFSVGNVQGLENNFRGLSLELECAEWAPAVTAVRKRFPARLPCVSAKLEPNEIVEVDVVAQNGLLWIECKAEQGDVSPNIVPQALALQRAARAPCNRRHFGRAPEIAVYLTGTLGESEADLLREAGVWVFRSNDDITAGPEGSDDFPLVPPPPVLANMDITALFALVSEVSNGGANNPECASDVRDWASRKPQHAACLNAELEAPLNLAEKLKRYDCLIAHPSVVERFLTILHTVGGPRERRRWHEEWSSRIKVTAPTPEMVDALEIEYSTSSATSTKGSVSRGGMSGTCAPTEREVRRQSVRRLVRIGNPQLDAFELGEVAMAMTFTGNGRAVTVAEEQGIFLEACVFRTIWLVGL